MITVSALADFDGLPGGGGAATCRSDVDDTLADFSNFGADIDLIAPGVSIHSTWKGGGYNTISGTSMASPHVAGAAALYKSGNGSASPAQVKSALEVIGNLVWDNSDDGDGFKETLLNVDALVGTTIIDGAPDNLAPVAAFTSSCTDLMCGFTNTSTDGDGTITTWDWTFGDGGISTVANPTHTYGAAGTYTVALTVTDDDGATGTASATVTVPAPATGGGITLEASGYKVKGLQKADLTWSGTTATVAIYRNGASIASDSDGAYTDYINIKGAGSYIYAVCEADTTTCSPEVTISF